MEVDSIGRVVVMRVYLVGILMLFLVSSILTSTFVNVTAHKADPIESTRTSSINLMHGSIE
jgi:hypothetical protein